MDWTLNVNSYKPSLVGIEALEAGNVPDGRFKSRAPCDRGACMALTQGGASQMKSQEIAALASVQIGFFGAGWYPGWRFKFSTMARASVSACS